MSESSAEALGQARVLLTGPSREREQWLDAVREAGWAPIDWPLIRIESLDADLESLLDGLPDWLCVTSPNALEAIEPSLEKVPELRAVPLALVGARTAKRAEWLGLRLGLAAATGARELAEALLVELGDQAAQTSVLWPRGSLAEELGDSLREAGVAVQDPIVYRTIPCEHDSAPPEAEALFFASPSAVRAWTQLGIERGGLAIAIGATTGGALRDAAPTSFAEILELEQPSPDALANLLRAQP